MTSERHCFQPGQAIIKAKKQKRQVWDKGDQAENRIGWGAAFSYPRLKYLSEEGLEMKANAISSIYT